MKKKSWISGMGWLALLGWGALVAAGLLLTISQEPAVRQMAEGMAVLGGFVGAACTSVWIVGSIIDGFMRRQASLQGAALAQALAGARQPQAQAGAWQPQAPAVPAGAVLCAFCRARAAVAVCVRHQWPSCNDCAYAHMQADPQCSYAPLAPAAPAPAAGPRAVVTSPLAGMR